MLQAKTLGALALIGVLAGSAAHADDRRSEPQIRVGIDLLWGGYGGGYGGGHGYAPPPPPVIWYPSRYVPYRYLENRHDRGRHRGEWRRNGHHKGDHRSRRGDDCDD